MPRSPSRAFSFSEFAILETSTPATRRASAKEAQASYVSRYLVLAGLIGLKKSTVPVPVPAPAAPSSEFPEYQLSLTCPHPALCSCELYSSFTTGLESNSAPTCVSAISYISVGPGDCNAVPLLTVPVVCVPVCWKADQLGGHLLPGNGARRLRRRQNHARPTRQTMMTAMVPITVPRMTPNLEDSFAGSKILPGWVKTCFTESEDQATLSRPLWHVS